MSASGRGRFTRVVKSGQRLEHIIKAKVNGTGTAAITLGGQELTLVDNGTGDYSFTYAQAFKQTPEVYAQIIDDYGFIQVTTESATGFDINIVDTDGSTALDAEFSLLIIGSDAEGEV